MGRGEAGDQPWIRELGMVVADPFQLKYSTLNTSLDMILIFNNGL